MQGTESDGCYVMLFNKTVILLIKYDNNVIYAHIYYLCTAYAYAYIINVSMCVSWMFFFFFIKVMYLIIYIRYNKDKTLALE